MSAVGRRFAYFSVVRRGITSAETPWQNGVKVYARSFSLCPGLFTQPLLGSLFNTEAR